MIEVPHVFLSSCRRAIDEMRNAGLNDVQIACVIQYVRSATLNEEFRRVMDLITASPPHHHRHGEIADAIERADREKRI